MALRKVSRYLKYCMRLISLLALHFHSTMAAKKSPPIYLLRQYFICVVTTKEHETCKESSVSRSRQAHRNCIRKRVSEGKIELSYINTKYQPADILMKPLGRVKFETHQTALGLRSLKAVHPKNTSWFDFQRVAARPTDYIYNSSFSERAFPTLHILLGFVKKGKTLKHRPFKPISLGPTIIPICIDIGNSTSPHCIKTIGHPPQQWPSRGSPPSFIRLFLVAGASSSVFTGTKHDIGLQHSYSSNWSASIFSPCPWICSTTARNPIDVTRITSANTAPTHTKHKSPQEPLCNKSCIVSFLRQCVAIASVVCTIIHYFSETSNPTYIWEGVLTTTYIMLGSR